MSEKALGRRLFARAAVGVPTALKFGGTIYADPEEAAKSH